MLKRTVDDGAAADTNMGGVVRRVDAITVGAFGAAGRSNEERGTLLL